MEELNIMKKIGIVSYNLYLNFTNYGSALQSYALFTAISDLSTNFNPVLIDYCPKVLENKNPLNPFENSWDQDKITKQAIFDSKEDIKINYEKYMNFFKSNFEITKNKYDFLNFNNIEKEEGIHNFVCGSDTIFCILEFNGFDDGYFANYDVMKNGYSFSYAASFGDATFENNFERQQLKKYLKNFKMIGVREATLVEYLKNDGYPITRVLDPTLLLDIDKYNKLSTKRLIEGDYLLLYSRRHNDEMIAYAEKIAKKFNLKIVDISLRAHFYDNHIPFYSAGVEEFLSLVRYSKYVITNSYHGAIFAIKYEKPLAVFSREQCDTKIDNLLSLLECQELLHYKNDDVINLPNYEIINKNIEKEKERSLEFLKTALEGCK